MPRPPARRSARVVATPAEVGRNASFVILGVGYDEEVAAVTTGTDGALGTLAPGGIVAVSSTVAPDTVKALDRTAVYEPYFRVRATYETSRGEAALGRRGIAPPELRSYFDRLVDFAVETRWGHRPLTRAEALERAGRPPRSLAVA